MFKIPQMVSLWPCNWQKEKALEYRECACAIPLSTKTARKHFHSQSTSEGALFVTIRGIKKVVRNIAFFFFMKQIEFCFQSESYFAMVLLRNDGWREFIWWCLMSSYVYRTYKPKVN